MSQETSEPKPLRVTILLNRTAGTSRRSREALGEKISAHFAGHGVTSTLEILDGTRLVSRTRQALRDARSGKIDALVIGGGDGSVATAARLFAGSHVPIGILPLGTFNHFARDLGIPRALEPAIDVIAARHVRVVDAGEVNGELFVNNSSIGIYPYLVVGRERLREQYGLGKWTAMILAAWRTLRHFPLRRLHIQAADMAEPYRSPCVFIGNNEYCLTGPVVGKRERLDAGELCIYVARQQSRFALFWLACRSLAGFMDQSRDLRAVTAAKVKITSHTSRLLVALDGEVTMLRSPLVYRARPNALKVFAPEPVNEGPAERIG